MNLRKKKNLAAKTLNVGRERIVFLKPRLDEVKDAITKQDIRDLHKDGAIIIKEIAGRKKVAGRVSRRGAGKIRKRIVGRKREYVIITRKLRKYIYELKKQGKISSEKINKIKEKIRNKQFKSKSQLKEHLKLRKS